MRWFHPKSGDLGNFFGRILVRMIDFLWLIHLQLLVGTPFTTLYWNMRKSWWHWRERERGKTSTLCTRYAHSPRHETSTCGTILTAHTDRLTTKLVSSTCWERTYAIVIGKGSTLSKTKSLPSKVAKPWQGQVCKDHRRNTTPYLKYATMPIFISPCVGTFRSVIWFLYWYSHFVLASIFSK